MVGDRIRRRLRRRRSHSTASPPEPRRGLGEPPAGDAGDAELDSLRGELLRELDRRASSDDGSGCFRRA